jgi:hypothetical protein
MTAFEIDRTLKFLRQVLTEAFKSGRITNVEITRGTKEIQSDNSTVVEYALDGSYEFRFSIGPYTVTGV